MTTVEEFWGRWKLAHERLRTAVVADVTAAAKISEPELSVLLRLRSDESPVRQNVIAAAVGWDRARLSHLLTRMEERGLVTRRKLTNGAEVTLTPAGAAVVEGARPALATAVQEHFLARLTPSEAADLSAILDKLIK